MIVRMVQVMYTNCTSAVVDGDGRTEWFKGKSGVKQGCNMSGFLFLLVIDWVMRRTVAHAGTGGHQVEDDNYSRGLSLRRRSGSHLKHVHTDSEEDRPPE